jgi:RNA recognition motif-containing protein
VAKNPPSFAYIEMEDPRDAEDAIKALDGTEICGMRARVEMAKGCWLSGIACELRPSFASFKI